MDFVERAGLAERVMGNTPAEFALHWRVASGTISNEKTRVPQ
jgi:hypothetical protein